MTAQIIKRLPLTFAASFDLLLRSVAWTASRQTRVLQNGSLFRYLVIIIGTILTAVIWALAAGQHIDFTFQFAPIDIWQGILVMLMLLAIVVTIRSSSKLLSICALGVVGAGIALIFLSFGAPDVALTQLLVETLTLIIVAIVLLRLPPLRTANGPRSTARLVRFGLALACGLMVTLLLLLVSLEPLDRTITEFYEKASYVKAHGRNIVNVILVDFRSLDTLGEIIVVAISAIACLALIRQQKEPR
jgi:multicomponent Na+:H+ antiporter subunit A